MIGKSLGHYEILALLGKGGMGEVYRALDKRLHREVAVKLLLPALAQDPSRLQRFEHEARSLAALNHPNISAICGIEHHDSQTFLVMELAQGDDLATRLRRSDPSSRERRFRSTARRGSRGGP